MSLNLSSRLLLSRIARETVRPSTSALSSSILIRTQTRSNTSGSGNGRVKIQYVKPGETFEPKIESKKVMPEYPLLNIRLRGYDYQILEKYQSYVHRIVRSLGAFIVESYSAPAESNRVDIYAPRTSTAISSFDISYYERTIQVAEVSSIALFHIQEVLANSVPEGVTIEIKKNEKKDQEVRYIPDFELLKLQKNLRDLDNIFVRRKLGFEE